MKDDELLTGRMLQRTGTPKLADFEGVQIDDERLASVLPPPAC
jgi:hypothetical protein